VIGARNRQTSHDHVSIADGFDFFQPVLVRQLIQLGKKRGEQQDSSLGDISAESA